MAAIPSWPESWVGEDFAGDAPASTSAEQPATFVVRRLYELHGDALCRYLVRILRCEATAEDVAQDTYARLLRYQPDIEPARSRSYLFQVALNIVRSQSAEKRSQSEFPSALEWESDLASDAPAPDRIVEARQALATLGDEIDRLPPRCRQVFVMHRLHGLTHEVIASRLQISRSMVEKHMIKAMTRCRRRINGSQAEIS